MLTNKQTDKMIWSQKLWVSSSWQCDYYTAFHIFMRGPKKTSDTLRMPRWHKYLKRERKKNKMLMLIDNAVFYCDTLIRNVVWVFHKWNSGKRILVTWFSQTLFFHKKRCQYESVDHEIQDCLSQGLTLVHFSKMSFKDDQGSASRDIF